VKHAARRGSLARYKPLLPIGVEASAWRGHHSAHAQSRRSSSFSRTMHQARQDFFRGEHRPVSNGARSELSGARRTHRRSATTAGNCRQPRSAKKSPAKPGLELKGYDDRTGWLSHAVGLSASPLVLVGDAFRLASRFAGSSLKGEKWRLASPADLKFELVVNLKPRKRSASQYRKYCRCRGRSD
jgi:hypothetical protein